MLDLPNLHDGFFDGVWLSERDSARLFFRTEQGQRLTIALEGLDSMKVTNLWAGNIIFEVVYVRPEQLKAEHVRDALYDGAQAEIVENLLIKAKKSGLSALQVTPSYGAECTFVFKEASLLPSHVIDQ